MTSLMPRSALIGSNTARLSVSLCECQIYLRCLCCADDVSYHDLMYCYNQKLYRVDIRAYTDNTLHLWEPAILIKVVIKDTVCIFTNIYGVSLFSPSGPTTIVHNSSQYLVLISKHNLTQTRSFEFSDSTEIGGILIPFPLQNHSYGGCFYFLLVDLLLQFTIPVSIWL